MIIDEAKNKEQKSIKYFYFFIFFHHFFFIFFASDYFFLVQSQFNYRLIKFLIIKFN